MTETIQHFLEELSIPDNHKCRGLQKMHTSDSRYLKDLKLNVSAVLRSGNLTREEAYMLALAVAVNEKCQVLVTAFEELATREGASDAHIAEIYACTSLMSANNVFYRFRHYLPQVKYYNDTPAGLRMSIMVKPIMSKEFFELVSLAVSALNGCERCVTAHEASVKAHGASEARIFDAIKLASVVRSLSMVL